MMPAVASTLHNAFSSCVGQIVNAGKPATAVVPVTVGTGIEFLDAGQKPDSRDLRKFADFPAIRGIGTALRRHFTLFS